MINSSRTFDWGFIVDFTFVKIHRSVLQRLHYFISQCSQSLADNNSSSVSWIGCHRRLRARSFAFFSSTQKIVLYLLLIFYDRCTLVHTHVFPLHLFVCLLSLCSYFINKHEHEFQLYTLCRAAIFSALFSYFIAQYIKNVTLRNTLRSLG